MDYIKLVKTLQSQQSLGYIKPSNILIKAAQIIKSISHILALHMLHDYTKMIVINKRGKSLD